MSYYDIDEILAETRTIPSIWLADAMGLGDLDSSADSSQKVLPKSTKVELPLYLASTLSAKGFIAADLPAFIRKNSQVEILSDPVGAELRSKCAYFYEFCCKLAMIYRHIAPNIADDIIATVRRCMGVRLVHGIVPRSGSFQSNDPTLLQFYDSLPELEKKFLQIKEQAQRELIAWKSGYLTILHPSPLIQYARLQAQKRKALVEIATLASQSRHDVSSSAGGNNNSSSSSKSRSGGGVTA